MHIVIFDISHIEISGNFNKDENPKNKKLILSKLLEFHFEISGNSFKEEHLKNKKDISLTLFTFHFEIIMFLKFWLMIILKIIIITEKIIKQEH